MNHYQFDSIEYPERIRGIEISDGTQFIARVHDEILYTAPSLPEIIMSSHNTYERLYGVHMLELESTLSKWTRSEVESLLNKKPKDPDEL